MRRCRRQRRKEGEILSRAIVVSASGSTNGRKKCRTKQSRSTEPSRDIARSGPRATLSERPRFEGSQSPAHDHVGLEGGFHNPRLSHPIVGRKEHGAYRRRRENEGRTLSRFVERRRSNNELAAKMRISGLRINLGSL